MIEGSSVAWGNHVSSFTSLISLSGLLTLSIPLFMVCKCQVMHWFDAVQSSLPEWLVKKSSSSHMWVQPPCYSVCQPAEHDLQLLTFPPLAQCHPGTWPLYTCTPVRTGQNTSLVRTLCVLQSERRVWWFCSARQDPPCKILHDIAVLVLAWTIICVEVEVGFSEVVGGQKVV